MTWYVQAKVWDTECLHNELGQFISGFLSKKWLRELTFEPGGQYCKLNTGLGMTGETAQSFCSSLQPVHRCEKWKELWSGDLLSIRGTYQLD